MINSVSRIMASNYRNNTKQNNTNFKGWREDFAKLERRKNPARVFSDAAYGPGPGLFSTLLSALNPLNILKSGLGIKASSRNKGLTR